MSTKPMGLSAAMRDFFGMKPGQTLKEFMEELKSLTDADKAEFRTALEARGYVITN